MSTRFKLMCPRQGCPRLQNRVYDSCFRGPLQCLLSRPDKEKPVTKVETKKETAYKYVLCALYDLLLTKVQD
jgi:hypothetical protein